MTAYERTQRLYGVRLAPESGPHAMVALLATSESEAEQEARRATSMPDAPATVRECAEGEPVAVTFK
jgi:hypothetical protein